MVYSMTGFGRAEILDGDKKIMVEMKSVNHRYLDMNIKMPKKLNLFESRIRGVVKEYIERGKVDVFITYEDFGEGAGSLQYNRQLAAEYLKHLKSMSEDFNLEFDIRTSTLSKYPDIFVIEEQAVDEDALWNVLERAIREACGCFLEAREQEGGHLLKDLQVKLDEILRDVDFIEERAPQILKDYRDRLESRVQEILGDRQIDDARVAAEVTIYADKVCVDEETVRLRSHVNAAKDALEKGGSVGRRLDFILQEMNREANTILSKANSIEISDTGISLKTNIEKVREQIQNLE